MELAHPLNRRYDLFYVLILIVSGALFFIPFLGKVHLFDWDEINFAESAREMIVTGNYHLVQINFEPFWEKPPLFFWLQVGAMKLFGINEFAARFPNAIFGIITLLTFYFIGRNHKSSRFGFLWALAYVGTFLPHLYFKTAIIDPVFNYFIFVGIYFMYRDVVGHRWLSKYVFPALSGIFIGLATLTKGPVGLLIFLLVYFVYFLIKKFKGFPSALKIITWLVFFILVSLLWFGEEVKQNGFWFLQEFIAYQIELFLEPVAGHGQPFYYHFVVVFIGCFPISVIALPIFLSRIKDHPRNLTLIMKVLFWAVMILFSITTTKIVHYSSLTYMPLAFLAATYLEHILNEHTAIKRYITVMLIVMGAVFSFLLAALPYVAANPETILPYINDEFARASLSVPVQWGGYESLIGIVYLLIVIFSVILLNRKRTMQGINLLFYATACCLFIYTLAVVPKIEQYSQGPAIRFYKSVAHEEAYVWPVGFKSYAQYFYGQKPVEPRYGNDDLDFLLHGPIDRPAYFVIKVTNDEFESNCTECTFIKQEGGFRFYKREAVR